MTHIPYSGSGPAQAALSGGHVDVLFDNAAAIIGLARTGAVKPLGITTLDRFRLAPDFPPIADTVPGYASGGWFGVGVRRGTPTHIQNIIEEDSLNVLRESATSNRLAASLSETVGGKKEEFEAFIGAERVRWGSIIKELNLKI